MKKSNEELRQMANRIYNEKIKINGDYANFGIINGLDEEAVCKMLGDTVAILSERMKESGQEVSEAVFEKLFGIIHSNMICTVSELSAAQKASEESIKEAIQQKFHELTEKSADFADRIYNEIQEFKRSIPDLQSAITSLAETYETKMTETLSQLKEIIRAATDEVNRNTSEVVEASTDKVNMHTTRSVEPVIARMDVIYAKISKIETSLSGSNLSTNERESLQKKNEGLKNELEKLQKETDWLNKPLNEIQIPQNVSGKIKKLFVAAKEGNEEAQYNLGSRYACGDGITQDPMWAAYWYKQSAEKGCAEAQFELGFFYKYGRGVEKNFQEAVRWYKEAADRNHAVALNNLGACYHNGEGVEKNYSEAVKLYNKAAELNEAYAYGNLGECYENALGVERNQEVAFDYYNKAVEIDPKCEFAWEKLACCYEKGIGTQKDNKMAEVCERRATGTLTVAESAERNINYFFFCIGVLSILFGFFFSIFYYKTNYYDIKILFPGESGFVWLTLEIVVPFALIFAAMITSISIEKYIKKNHKAKSRSRSSVIGTAILLTILSCSFGLPWICMGYIKSYDIEQDGLYYNFQEDGTLEVCNIDTKRQEIIIPKEVNGISITSIGNDAFRGCDSLINVTFEDGSVCSSIGKSAFNGCNKLTSITIPESITSIGQCVFQHCDSLKEVYFNAIACDDLENGSNTFVRAAGNENGISVIIGKNVTRIPAYLFGDAYEVDWSNDIISVTFEDGSVCSSIGEMAFSGCDKLTSITIPESITSIGQCVFQHCDSLKEVYFNAIACDDLENGSNTFVRAAGNENGISVIIGKNVTRIPAYLFSNAYKVEWSNDILSVAFEDGSVCSSIGDRAFDGCNQLESINLPDKLMNIGEEAFDGCNQLTSIFIPNSVTKITYYAFDGCESLTIYCEATKKPNGWASSWNADDRPVVWGAKRNS